MELSAAQITQAVIAAFLVGFSKTGVPGLGILIVPLMAAIFPPKESTGALLPMLLLADCFAVLRYRQHADWRILARLLPWIVPGLTIGYFTLRGMTDASLGPTLGVLVLLLVLLQIGRERGGEWLERRLPHQWWFAALMGTMAGFATMVGNVAGALMSIYLLSVGLEKNQFMGTGALYYLIVNAAKIPLSAHLGLITSNSLVFNLKVAPIVIAGAFVGIWMFRHISQKWFNRTILILSALAALRLIGWQALFGR